MQAATLSLGTSAPADVFSLSCGPPLATTSATFVKGRITATLTASVCSDPDNPFGAGDLDFLYQLTNSAVSLDGVGRIRGISFLGFSIDAGYATNLGGTVPPQMVDSSQNGSAVSFGFAVPLEQLILPGAISTVLVVKTNSNTFSPGTVNVIDGAVTTVSAYQPGHVTEPASMILMGVGLLAVGCFRKLRRT
jgi:hypothetical protein